MLCEQCGSSAVGRARSSRIDRIVRFFTGRKRYLCLDCGWTALRAWTHQGYEEPMATPDPRAASRPDDFDIDRFH